MAEYAAAREAASKPKPLPERVLSHSPRAVRSWRMAVLRYNAWRRASTIAKRRCDVSEAPGHSMKPREQFPMLGL